MKAKEVLRLLNISRVTLSHYVSNDKIIVTKLDNGYYDYDKNSVFKLLKKDPRTNVIYARVSTYKQKNDLDNQVSKLIEYCNNNHIKYTSIYKDISSGLDLNRKDFSKLLDDIINYKISKIFITYKDRITMMSYSMLESLFNKFGTEIIIINKDNENNDNELFEDLISLIHIFSTKMYSNRRKKKLNIMKTDLSLFNDI